MGSKMAKKPSKKKDKKPAGKRGPAPIQINWDQVDELCKIQCTGPEIIAVLGISDDTLYKRCMEDHGVKLSTYIKSKSQVGKASLRRAQFKNALKGNSTMQVWLGKQMLNQGDKVTIDLPTPTIIQKRDGTQVIMAAKESETLEGEVIEDEEND